MSDFEDGMAGIPDDPVVGEWVPVPGQIYDETGMPLPVPPPRPGVEAETDGEAL